MTGHCGNPRHTWQSHERRDTCFAFIPEENDDE